MPPDLMRLFELNLPWWELVVRGSVMYWLLFAIFRFMLRRNVGSLGIADVLLLVLIADSAQNAMAGGYDTITEGALLIGTIAGWNYLLDWASYRFAAVRRFAEAPPLLLVSKGRILRHNLHKELVTLEELMSKLREKGLENVASVKAAYMEGDGQVTVIRYPPSR